MHGIIALNNTIGQPQGIAPTIGDIAGAYKSLIRNNATTVKDSPQMGKVWQRNYYEHTFTVRNCSKSNLPLQLTVNN